MQKINLEQIIEDHDLDKKNLAEQLFPHHKYAVLAMNRVLSGEGILDAEQISKLSLISGVPISKLFSSEKWELTNRKHLIVLTNDEYTAEVDTRTWATKVYASGSMFHETVLTSSHIALSDFTKKLDSIINKFNKNSKNK